MCAYQMDINMNISESWQTQYLPAVFSRRRSSQREAEAEGRPGGKWRDYP